MTDAPEPDDEPTNDDELLEAAQQAFELVAERENKARRQYNEQFRFWRLAEQWDERVRRQRELDQRPCLTINRGPAFIRQVVNDARQNKPAIMVHPANDGADQATAEVYNDLIRNIEVTSNADVSYDTAIDCSATGGFGYITVSSEFADDDSFDLDLRINTVADPLSIYGDPYSLSVDGSDWNSAFETEWVTVDDLKRRFPKAEAVSWDDYRTCNAAWKNEDSKRVLIAKWWRRKEEPRTIVKLSTGETVDKEVFDENPDVFEGAEVVDEREVPSHTVSWVLMTGAEVLKEGKWGGKYIPVVPVYGDTVVVEGERHLIPMLRDAQDSQRNFNYWRTSATELVALAPKAPFIGKKGAFESDIGKWETANIQSHAYIEYDGAEAPERQAFAGVPAGALQEASNASDDMKAIIGLHDASLGAQGNEVTGKAILARQREGDVSTFHLIDNLARSIRQLGRILLDLIPTVYSGSRVLRVMGVDGKPATVQIGPQAVPPQQIPGAQPQPGPPQPGASPMQVATGPLQPGQPQQPPGAPQAPPQPTPQMTAPIYDLTAGKYDLTVEAGPSYSTKREEEAQQMLQLVTADSALALPLAPIIAKNLDWHGADDVEKALAGMQQAKASSQPNPQAELQAAAQKQQGEMALAHQKQQGEMQLAQQKAAADIQLQKSVASATLQLKQQEMQMDYELKKQEMAMRVPTTPTVGADVQFGGQPG